MRDSSEFNMVLFLLLFCIVISNILFINIRAGEKKLSTLKDERISLNTVDANLLASDFLKTTYPEILIEENREGLVLDSVKYEKSEVLLKLTYSERVLYCNDVKDLPNNVDDVKHSYTIKNESGKKFKFTLEVKNGDVKYFIPSDEMYKLINIIFREKYI